MSEASELIQKWVDGLATADERDRLSALLRDSDEARREYVEAMHLTAALHGASRVDLAVAALSKQDRSPRSSRVVRGVGRRRTWGATVAAAAAMVLAAIGYAFLDGSPPTQAPLEVLSVSELVGTIAHVTIAAEPLSLPPMVETRTSGGPRRAAVRRGYELRQADRVITGDGQLVFTYLEETTRISLEPGSVAHVSSDGSSVKRLELERGTISADVVPQTGHARMEFGTEQAEVTVVGTRLSLTADATSTHLEVQQGEVSMAPRSGGRVLVGAGQFATATSAGVIASGDIEIPEERGRDGVFFDFEDGRIPPLWRAGRVSEEPEREGSTSCLAGEEYSPTDPVAGVRIADFTDGVFVVDADMRVRFEYWIGPDAKSIQVWLYDRTQKKSFHYDIATARHEVWVHVEFDLTAMLEENDEPVQIAAGDRIDHFLILTNSTEENRIFVDDVGIAVPTE